jgi:hypothetical protein
MVDLHHLIGRALEIVKVNAILLIEPTIGVVRV